MLWEWSSCLVTIQRQEGGKRALLKPMSSSHSKIIIARERAQYLLLSFREKKEDMHITDRKSVNKRQRYRNFTRQMENICGA